MGEYANHPTNGDRIKLGTCESLMYVSLDDLKALHRAGWTGDGASTMRGYLKEAAFRCALPRVYDVPGDVETIGNRKPEFDHRIRISIDDVTAAALVDVDHGNIYHHAAGVNIIIPCPLGKDWKAANLKTSPMSPYIELCAEGCGNGRAVYRCPFCGALFNLAGHDAQNRVRAAFCDQWMKGRDKLPEQYGHRLLAAIDWKPGEPPTNAATWPTFTPAAEPVLTNFTGNPHD